MTTHLITERCIIREVDLTDLSDFFEMDSDPLVHKYLGNKPVKTIKESELIIESIKEQYRVNGIGRWVIEDKHTGDFIGWTGLKLEQKLRDFSYYDIGYRLKQKYWGYGFAYETAKACLDHGFNTLELPAIGAAAEQDHVVSNHILKKLGLKHKGNFAFDTSLCNWYWLSREEWLHE